MTSAKRARAAAATAASIRAKYRGRRYRDDRDPAMTGTVKMGHGCWCGAPFGHDWPGKAERAPHPRDWPGRVNGHPYRGPADG